MRTGAVGLALVALSLGVVVPGAAQEAGAGFEPSTFEIRALHPRVHAALVVDRPPYYAFANSLVVVGDSGVLVVDTQQSPGAAGDLIRALPTLTDRPVRWVVNTHWHPDHVFGNGAWKEAFPEAVVIGHRSLLRDVPERAGAARDTQRVTLPAMIRAREEWLATGRRDGEALDSAGRAAVAYSLDVNRRYLEQLRGLQLLPPDVVVDDSLTLDLGGITARVLHVGPAHTPGDLVVVVTGTRIAAVGDLLEWGAPWLDGACVPGWARALDRIRRLPVDTLVMSHGPVTDREFLDLYAQVLDAIVAGRELDGLEERLEAVGLEAEAFRRAAEAAPSLMAAADSAGACPTEPGDAASGRPGTGH